MALHHNIRTDIDTGLVPRVFRAAHLMYREDPENAGNFLVGDVSYAKTTLQTTPNNLGISTDGLERGNHVRSGQSAAYFRLGGGRFELIPDAPSAEVGEDTEVLDDGPAEERQALDAEQDRESCVNNFTNALPPSSPALDRQPLDPVAIIVESIEGTPYRRWFKKQKICHPEEEAADWEARLKAYFWPALANTWDATSVTLGDFRIRYMALGIDEGNADSDVAGQHVSLFRDICSWGGVKLPEDDPARLFREVAVALHQLDRGEIPRGCCINSAWTKLYALARPDTCVIYDSRVAASLTSILDPYMADLVNSPLYEP